MGKVYSRRKYRKYKKGYKKYKLSKGNIYGRTSAKSQAVQIAALKKRIDTVYKMCAPDIVTAVGHATRLFTNQSITLASTYLEFYYMPGFGSVFSNVDSSGGEVPRAKADSVFNVQGGYFKFTCTYSNNYYTVADSGNANRYANVRVIFLRRKTCFNSSPTGYDPASYLQDYSATGKQYLINHLVGFREGVNSEVEVLYDKWKTITEHQPQCSFRVKVPKLLMKYMNNVTYPANALYGFLMVDGLSYTDTAKVANVDVQCISRLCYSANSVDAT